MFQYTKHETFRHDAKNAAESFPGASATNRAKTATHKLGQRKADFYLTDGWNPSDNTASCYRNKTMPSQVKYKKTMHLKSK